MREIKPVLDLPLIHLMAEGDYVTTAFVRPEKDAHGETYYSSWFDLYRIEDGKIAEHWDPMLKSDPQDRSQRQEDLSYFAFFDSPRRGDFFAGRLGLARQRCRRFCACAGAIGSCAWLGRAPPQASRPAWRPEAVSACSVRASA